MPNVRFAWDNQYTAAATVLTASSSKSALPVGATKNTDRNYVWQSLTAADTPTIDIDLGSVQPVSAAMLANVSVFFDGAVQLYQRGDAAVAGAPIVVATFPHQDVLRRTTSLFIAEQSHRHWQLKWTNPFAVVGFAALGFAFLGTYDEPAINVRVPIPMSRIDPTSVSQSSDGQKGFATRSKYQAGAWVFDAVQEGQRVEVERMFDAIGVAQPFFAVLDTGLPWTCWLQRVVNGLPVEIEPGMALGRYGVQVPWEEVR